MTGLMDSLFEIEVIGNVGMDEDVWKEYTDMIRTKEKEEQLMFEELIMEARKTDVDFRVDDENRKVTFANGVEAWTVHRDVIVNGHKYGDAKIAVRIAAQK